MLELNAPPIKTSWCRWDEPQSIYVAWRERPRRGLGRLFGPRLVIEVTDSKLGAASPIHEMSLGEWERFLRRVVARTWFVAADGRYRLGDLAFTGGEVRAFRLGALGGEFDLPLRMATT
jgi:hypothetical protein